MAPYRDFFGKRFARLEEQLANERKRRSHDDTAVTHSFTLDWVLDASPAEVFRAWTDPEHLGWFYNPDNPIPAEPIELDLRVGGAWRQLMVIDESTTY